MLQGLPTPVISERDLDIIYYVCLKKYIPLKDLENYIALKYNVTHKTAHKIILRLKKHNILKFRRISRTLWVQIHPSFVRLISMLYSCLMERAIDLNRK